MHIHLLAGIGRATHDPYAWYSRADLCASGQQVRALMDAAQTILDRGYVSQSIAEEKPDHDALRDALAALTPAPQPEGPPDDLAVDRFAAAMKAKLAKKRTEGRGGWDRKDECSAELLSRLLREHVEKGDPVDVGNLAMMLHQRGERIVPGGEAKSIAPQPEGEAVPKCVACEDSPKPPNVPCAVCGAHPAQPGETVAAVERAFADIRELNMLDRDENGHRWANSDLIDQTVTSG